MEALLVLGLYGLIGYAVYKHHTGTDTTEPDAPEDNDLLFEELEQRAVQLAKDTERLRKIEQLITDLELCEPDRFTKAIELHWASVSGRSQSYQFWSDGRYNTDHLLRIAYEERRALRSSLLSQIEEMHGTVITQTVTQTTDFEAEGEGF